MSKFAVRISNIEASAETKRAFQLRTRALFGHPGRFAMTYTLGLGGPGTMFSGIVWRHRFQKFVILVIEEHCGSCWHVLLGPFPTTSVSRWQRKLHVGSRRVPCFSDGALDFLLARLVPESRYERCRTRVGSKSKLVGKSS